jgi:tetratricopeptide (TPR) repeat protein
MGHRDSLTGWDKEIRILKRLSIGLIALLVGLVVQVLEAGRITVNQEVVPFASTPKAQSPALKIDYPAPDSIFPPDISAPTFIWHGPDETVTVWQIEVSFPPDSKPIKIESAGEKLQVGEIDPRCIADTNKLPILAPEMASAHTWQPDEKLWGIIKTKSTERTAMLKISGFSSRRSKQPVSQGWVTFKTSSNPVGAPIFYRDVPLMPSESAKGVIKPLAPSALPLIAWRLRNVAERHSRLLVEGLHTCANCHSFSLDGKTLGMDVDGPSNDKGLYALAAVKSRMSIGTEDVIRWSTYRGPLGGSLRVGFMSQVSPDGKHVITMINDPGQENHEHMEDLLGKYFVINFKDYRFLQVFYPTRGILAWYGRDTGKLQPLPGADNPQFVQTTGVWNPDGKSLVFARAGARSPYPKDGVMPEYANDPQEPQIQYDLCRIPFNEGRGGVAEFIQGASRNGMSNNFPKISPDGKWIVFVQCRNGLLMRPDSQLYIVPSGGGTPRRMNCNTSLMNSWHSFSPNGRWLVFSSKSRSPYTQMYLTHLDENGMDSPPILIENSTAANRAVNLPEFVNIPPDSLQSIEAPATRFYELLNHSTEFISKGQNTQAMEELQKALELNTQDARIYNYMGVALGASGKPAEAMVQYQKALTIDPQYAEPEANIGLLLAREGKQEEALPHFEKALQSNPQEMKFHSNLAATLANLGRTEEAMIHCQFVLSHNPEDMEANSNMGVALAKSGHAANAIPYFEKALAVNPKSAETHAALGFALIEVGRGKEAIGHFGIAVEVNAESVELRRALGRVLAENGYIDQAISHFEKAVQLMPQSAELHYNLGKLLAMKKEFNQAISHFEKSVELAPQFAEGPYTLAAAYAAMGRFPEALTSARHGLEVARKQNNQALIKAFTSQISIYQTQVPAGK